MSPLRVHLTSCFYLYIAITYRNTLKIPSQIPRNNDFQVLWRFLNPTSRQLKLAIIAVTCRCTVYSIGQVLLAVLVSFTLREILFPFFFHYSLYSKISNKLEFSNEFTSYQLSDIEPSSKRKLIP